MPGEKWAVRTYKIEDLASPPISEVISKFLQDMIKPANPGTTSLHTPISQFFAVTGTPVG